MGTRYRYFTPDGGPPNGGAPPGSPKNPPGFGPFEFLPIPIGPLPLLFGTGPSPPPQYTRHPVGPDAHTPSTLCQPSSTPPPGAIYIGPHSSSAPPGAVFIGSQPPPAPGHRCTGHAAPNSHPYSNAPPPGCRVKGLLPKFPDRNSGYIFPKSNCTFHVVKGDIKPWEWQGLKLDFNVMHAPTTMTLAEFIEQVGAIEKAPPGTPRSQIGVVEALEGGNGTWHRGTAFTLGDEDWRVKATLQEVGWDNNRGEAGRSKPVTLVFLP